ncbi:hypothetical protein K2X85_17885 [bacterium]|nr:hypothetical protein [bacterium]
MNSFQGPGSSFWSRPSRASNSVTLAGVGLSPSAEPEAPMPTFSAQMHQLPEDRKQLIFRIRRQIAENRYDSTDKLELALDRMFRRIDADRR